MLVAQICRWGLFALCAGFGIACAVAGEDRSGALKAVLQERYPKLQIQDVRPAALPDMYEVFTGSQLVYSDAGGDHLFVGKVLDTRTQQDLAAERLQERLRIDFKSLPFERAIKIVKGSGARSLALFEDPDCPYCQQLEKQIAELNDVTLYVFLFPLAELHPDARAHAEAIWCAPDRGRAWTRWMLEREAPEAKACAKAPIDALQSLGAKLNVAATPTLFLADGRRLQGVIPAGQLAGLMAGS